MFGIRTKGWVLLGFAHGEIFVECFLGSFLLVSKEPGGYPHSVRRRPRGKTKAEADT
jgi:hypothetical protein